MHLLLALVQEDWIPCDDNGPRKGKRPSDKKKKQPRQLRKVSHRARSNDFYEHVAPIYDEDDYDYYFRSHTCLSQDEQDEYEPNWDLGSSFLKCKTAHDAWSIMNSSRDDLLMIYQMNFGFFPEMPYIKTFNTLSRVVERWVDTNSFKFFIVYRFLRKIFGDTLVMFEWKQLKFTGEARSIADDMFGISAFHSKLKEKRDFVCLNAIKQHVSTFCPMKMPWTDFEEAWEEVRDPEGTLERELESKVEAILSPLYVKFLEKTVAAAMD